MGRLPQPVEDRRETLLLVGVRRHARDAWDVRDSLEELAQLSASAGGWVVGQIVCRQAVPNPGTFVGKGKVEEIAAWVREHQVMTVVFDDDLSPAQVRNLEALLGAKVIDRTQVILDIFAQHAHTREGRLQVGLAQMEYLLPRLRRLWPHLERQPGGIGMRGGPGEQQLELDRRRIQQRILHYRRDLQHVRRHRAELRRGRRRHGWALVCMVGYTNAGKSTLLNSLTGASADVRDQLFVTLDPTTRQVRLPNHQAVLLTDTVGFIRKLPHHLVEAFKATLEEVVEADLLLHVVDASHPRVEQQIEAVHAVLRELQAHAKPVVAALNKIDKPGAKAVAARLARQFERAVPISALTGEGLDSLRHELADALRSYQGPVRLRIPLSEAKLLAQIRAAGTILEQSFCDQAVVLVACVPARLRGRCAPYFVDNDAGLSYNADCAGAPEPARDPP